MKKFLPILPSNPIPVETSLTLAPTFSHKSAISLIKVILVAKKEFAAYLISSAVSLFVNKIGVSKRYKGL